MNNIIILMNVIVGLCIILYGMTRNETNFNMLLYALTTDAKISNKKGFLKEYKISSLIIGFLLLISSFLIYADILSDKYIGFYLPVIVLLKYIMRIFIQIKYTKRTSNVKKS
ncbi:MAG: hypothetical protein ACREVX_04585 [Clostridium sp.]|uniref:hypothetical protein n=1 Tax=Clostridium sp. TaxID=1506 RepID=UPI003D6CC556